MSESKTLPVYNKKNELIGSGYIYEGYLLINDDYEIDAWEIKEVINLSDPDLPSNYYEITE